MVATHLTIIHSKFIHPVSQISESTTHSTTQINQEHRACLLYLVCQMRFCARQVVAIHLLFHRTCQTSESTNHPNQSKVSILLFVSVCYSIQSTIKMIASHSVIHSFILFTTPYNQAIQPRMFNMIFVSTFCSSRPITLVCRICGCLLLNHTLSTIHHTIYGNQLINHQNQIHPTNSVSVWYSFF